MAALVAAAFAVNAYRRRYYGGLLVAPAIAVLFVMNIFPLLWSFGLSFFTYQCQPAVHPLRRPQQLHQGSDRRGRGSGTGTRLHQHRHVRRCCTVSAQMIVGFLLAMLFAKQFPLRQYLLILVLTPMMLSFVAVGVFFPTTTSRPSAS